MTNSNSSISKHYHQLTSVQRGQIQAMFGLEDNLIRLDMSEYMDQIASSKLIGSA
ncbi:hypothetical protein HUK47_11600, partial [Lactobacillus crispatus]|nr:hypothetical protein [Lactobacillus crispatus]